MSPSWFQFIRWTGKILFRLQYVTKLGTKSGRLNTFEETAFAIKLHVREAKTQISLRTRADWSESSLSAWRRFGLLTIHIVPREDFYQTSRMRRLIWVFAGRTCNLVGNTVPRLRCNIKPPSRPSSYSSVDSVSDFRSRGRKFESHLGQITSIEIFSRPSLPSVSSENGDF